MPFSGVTLQDLNNFMKNYPTGEIVPSEYYWGSLYDQLKGKVKTDGFKGNFAEISIQTGYSFTGQAFGEDVDVPFPGKLSFILQYIPLKEVIVNAGLSSQAMDMANTTDDAWGKIVDLVLKNQMDDFKWLMELCIIGDGTGRLARVSAGPSNANGSGTYTFTCDNTYTDFGWENTHLIKVGMKVDVYSPAGVKVISGGIVTAVNPGNRNNGTATTGTVTINGTVTNGPISNWDNYVIFLANTYSLGLLDSKVGSGVIAPTGGKCYEATDALGTADVNCALPMGLVGLVQTTASGKKYTDNNLDFTLDIFQGLDRSSYKTLNAYVFDRSDLDGGTRGTPTDWDLSTISDAINQVNRDTGGEINVLVCSSELAMAISRRMQATYNTTISVSGEPSKIGTTAAGVRFANTFIAPDGRSIPIIVSRTIPRNVLYGLTTEDLIWFVRGSFDYKRPYGEIWAKSFNDRKLNYEAPYGGYTQIGAKRCDRCFVIQDLADNI